MLKFDTSSAIIYSEWKFKMIRRLATAKFIAFQNTLGIDKVFLFYKYVSVVLLRNNNTVTLVLTVFITWYGRIRMWILLIKIGRSKIDVGRVMSTLKIGILKIVIYGI